MPRTVSVSFVPARATPAESPGRSPTEAGAGWRGGEIVVLQGELVLAALEYVVGLFRTGVGEEAVVHRTPRMPSPAVACARMALHRRRRPEPLLQEGSRVGLAAEVERPSQRARSATPRFRSLSAGMRSPGTHTLCGDAMIAEPPRMKRLSGSRKSAIDHDERRPRPMNTNPASGSACSEGLPSVGLLSPPLSSDTSTRASADPQATDAPGGQDSRRGADHFASTLGTPWTELSTAMRFFRRECRPRGRDRAGAAHITRADHKGSRCRSCD